MLDPRLRQWLRFLIGGGINTAATYAVYLLLHAVLAYQVAYLLAYAAGIVFSYWFNARVVFRTALSWKGLAAYPLVYLVQYAASALLLGALVESADISKQFAPLIVTALMMPLTYLMSKIVLDITNQRCKKPQ